MHRTEKLRAYATADTGRANLALFVATALLAMGVAYAMLLAQPELVQGLSRIWTRVPNASTAPGWALPAVAAGVAIAGAAVGVIILSAFVRGVQAHPFAWLAPVLIGFSTFVMSGMSIDLPWSGLSLRAFSLLAGLVLLGGGAALQLRGAIIKIAGFMLLALPLAALIAGYGATREGLAFQLAKLGATGQLFVFVLALTSVGIGFMAFVTKRAVFDPALLVHRVNEAMDRVRESERRAAAAERRAQLAEQRLGAPSAPQPWTVPSAGLSDAEAAEFAALARPGMSRTVWIGAGAFVLAAAVAGMHFGLVRPAERRAAMQQALFAERAKEHAAEIDELRKHFAKQQAQLEAQLAAERTKGAAPGLAAPRSSDAAPETADQAAPAASQPAAETPKQAPAEAKPAKAASKPSEARARRPARRAPRKAEPVAAPAATPAEPDLDRATQRALRETIDDDPIGGLE